MNGVANFYTGTPFTPTLSTSTLNGTGTQRPNRIGSGVLSDPTVQEWFNIAAFTAPAPYVYGNPAGTFSLGPAPNNWTPLP